MKQIFTFFIILFAQTAFSQLVRDYFFDESLPINDSTSLIVVTRRAQTQFAYDFQQRVYTDTAFLRKLKTEWYYMADYSKGFSKFNCDFDLFFYVQSGSTFSYISCLNSKCSEFDLKKGDLQLLLESGKPMRIDTLTRMPFTATPEKLFNKDYIGFFTEGKVADWSISGNKQFPPLYYDGFFTTTIELDTSKTLDENANIFLKKYIPSTKEINWNINPSDSLSEFLYKKKPTQVQISFYLKQKDFKSFQDFKMEEVEFNIPYRSSLILLYHDRE